MRKKVVLLVPLTFNNGNAVPQEILDGIYAELYACCGGLTVVGKVQGSYRMTDGARQNDVLEQVWVAVEETEMAALKQLVAKVGSLLGQESMYFEITDSHVEFLPPISEEGPNHE